MERKELDLWQSAVLGALGLLLFMGLWELAVQVNLIKAFFLPPPSQVIRRAYQMTTGERPVLFYDIAASARRVLVGFLLSAGVGVPCGLLLGMSSKLRAAFNPIISMIRPLPAMSWIPLSILWLNIEEKQKYAIVFMGCFASIMVYTTDATMRVSTTLRLAAMNLGASRFQVIRFVILPGALPDILTGLKVSLAVAWTCVISAEMVGATSGLGFRILAAREYSDTDQIVVGMLCISLTVLVLDLLFRGLERLLLPWQKGTPGT